MMTEEQRGKEFPIHIEMGDDPPILDLGSRAAALNLPKTGCVLVDYKLNKDGTLTVRTLCMQDPAAGDDDDGPGDLEDALNQYGKRKPKESAEEDED
jgi:hypothetical protein